MNPQDELFGSIRALSEEIYRLARNQPQYESLVAAGVRGVESKGCLLKDCITSLDSNTDAKSYPSGRLVEARQSGLTLTEVSELIDERIYQATKQ